MQIQTLTPKNKTSRESRTSDAKWVSKLLAIDPVEESLKLATPAWPLQNTVAVNPFWFFRDRRFERVLEDLTSSVHASLLMPLEFYLRRFRSGEISEPALREALAEAKSYSDHLPESIEELILLSQAHAPVTREHQTLAESIREETDWAATVVAEVGKYSSAYFDGRQALAKLPWQEEAFWQAWLNGQKYDRAMEVSGARGFEESVARLRGMTAREAIAFMLEAMGLHGKLSQIAYMRRLIATVLGWGTQFKYVEWQRQLGYENHRLVMSPELLAVRMAYDFGLFRAFELSHASQIAKWRSSLVVDRVDATEDELHVYHYQAVFQLALELSYQKNVGSRILENRTITRVRPKAQMAFCIDVRSEMLRRHIESRDEAIQTIGFAGFFGLPFDYKRLDEREAGHRLPVLLTPAFKTRECTHATHAHEAEGHQNRDYANSFFRNLRKNPVSSFLYVELFGGLYIAKMVKRSWKHWLSRWRGQDVPERFESEGAGPSLKHLSSPQGPMDVKQKGERAAAVLQHMGLTSGFAELVFIVGHGAETTNNAFGSALDCGACGGHAGDINARLLADLLNDAEVREELETRGISIPDATWFVAAVHETVTDRVSVLDEQKIPLQFRATLTQVRASLAQASVTTREERLEAVSNVLDRRAERRAHNWSEVRPEWGLTGNACFVVAPRERTRGINLSSRSFLHDYDWRKDAATGYKTLELIMTAPMVVTNWINMQYFASTVAPSVYGSGNKILHNLTNETGVVEGNGGDLRVGLPIQSVHDGRDFVHDPLRLSVFIEAPRLEIEKIIEKHEVVRQLIGNGWLHLLQIDPNDGKIRRRAKGGSYIEI